MASRIPTRLSDFDIYIMNVNQKLGAIAPGDTLTKGEILGLFPDEVTRLNTLAKQWRSGDHNHAGIYEIHLDPFTKTKISRARVLNFIKDFRNFFMPLVVRMSASPNITPADRLDLHIAEPGNKPSHKAYAIAEQCIAMVSPIGGGDIKIKCRTAHDSSRPSKPEWAEGVEIAYTISDNLPRYDNLQNQKVKDMIVSPVTGTTKAIFSKASFIMHLGAENAGRNLQFFVRWVNIKHPELSGPFTGPYSTIIS
jgi:hypothetical protein